jgi:hypothetical protein
MIRLLFGTAVATFMVGCSTAKVTPLSTPAPTPSPADPLSILAIPNGLPILCRVPEPDPGKPQQPPVLREFRFGQRNTPFGPWPREISVGFDSLGHGFVLIDEVNFGMRGNQSVLASVGPAGNATLGRFGEVTVDSVAMAAALASGDRAAGKAAVRPAVQRDLSPGEWVQARALAAWLWQRRCGRS